MWPWDHLAFGYFLYAILLRTRRVLGTAPTGPRMTPSDRAAVALAFGTQFPDLVDKPLAWVVGILPTGVTLAHSLFVALPIVALALLAERRWALGDVGVAFAVGYLSHLAGDLLYPLLVEGGVSITYLMWPLVPKPDNPDPVLVNLDGLWTQFVQFLATPRGQLYLLLEVAFLAVTVGLWLWDGGPGTRWVRRPERR